MGLRLCPLVLVAAPGLLTSQSPASAEAHTIEHIELEQRNVFDSTELGRWYERLANQLHVTTRPAIVERELLFRKGDSLDPAKLAESARNLRNLGLFRDVHIDTVDTDSGLTARVVTRDAWSTKIIASYKSTSGATTFSAGAAEANLLGRDITVGFRYRNDPDRESYRFGVLAPRILRNRVGLDAEFDILSDGDSASLAVTAPFLSLSTRDSAGVSGEVFDGTVLRFAEGSSEPRERLRRVFAIARLGAAIATTAGNSGYVRLGVTGQLRRDDFVADTFSGTIPRTITGAIILGAELRRATYIETHYYESLGRREDVDLSLTLSLGVSIAPRAWGYDRSGIGPQLNVAVGSRIPHGFFLVDASASTLFTSAGLDSGTFSLGTTLVFQPAERHSLVLNATVEREKNPYPGEEFDIGFTIGPRAFPAHAFTGDRAYFGMAEYRWTIAQNVFKLFNVGVGAFAEHGGAWFTGQPRRTGTDVGIGIRFAGSRGSSGKGTTRIDFARRFANDVEKGRWLIVFGSGFPIL